MNDKIYLCLTKERGLPSICFGYRPKVGRHEEEMHVVEITAEEAKRGSRALAAEKFPDKRLWKEPARKAKPPTPVHSYRVEWQDGAFETDNRHYAVQKYVSMRKRLKDFVPAEERKVKMFCDGEEYYNVDEKKPGRPLEGESARQLTGMVRPFPSERRMP